MRVVGGAPLRCELAQAFSRLGCEVIIAGRDPFLPGEERDAAELLAQALRRDGIEVLLNTELVRVTCEDDGKRVHHRNYDQDDTVTVDEILVGAGRVPNVDGLYRSGRRRVRRLARRARRRPHADYQPEIYAAGQVPRDLGVWCMKQ